MPILPALDGPRTNQKLHTHVVGLLYEIRGSICRDPPEGQAGAWAWRFDVGEGREAV